MTAKIKIGRNDQGAGGDHQAGILKVWILPVIAIVILIVLAIFLFPLIIRGAFTQYANCDYLVVTRLRLDPFFCDGYDVKVLGATVFTIPGMKNVVDPPLELLRSAAAWGVILLFAWISLFLTIIIVNIKSIIGLITFHKEEWIKFIAGTRIWLLLFVGICTIFYFAVVK
ncbi:MAG: hypothetical protein JW748_00235 [Anaerolineales bacterium]|nr:hypothetical protein [Anaerolineales bacterium]